MLLLTGHVLHADLLGRVRASFPLAPLCLHSRSAPPAAVPGLQAWSTRATLLPGCSSSQAALLQESPPQRPCPTTLLTRAPSLPPHVTLSLSVPGLSVFKLNYQYLKLLYLLTVTYLPPTK